MTVPMQFTCTNDSFIWMYLLLLPFETQQLSFQCVYVTVARIHMLTTISEYQFTTVPMQLHARMTHLYEWIFYSNTLPYFDVTSFAVLRRDLVHFNILKDLFPLRKLPVLSSWNITKNSIKIALKMHYTRISFEPCCEKCWGFFFHMLTTKMQISIFVVCCLFVLLNLLETRYLHTISL